jgi:hypothetical protein
MTVEERAIKISLKINAKFWRSKDLVKKIFTKIADWL